MEFRSSCTIYGIEKTQYKWYTYTSHLNSLIIWWANEEGKRKTKNKMNDFIFLSHQKEKSSFHNVKDTNNQGFVGFLIKKNFFFLWVFVYDIPQSVIKYLIRNFPTNFLDIKTHNSVKICIMSMKYFYTDLSLYLFWYGTRVFGNFCRDCQNFKDFKVKKDEI